MPTTILHKESLIPGRTSKLVLDAPQIAATAKPGHFVMLRVNDLGCFYEQVFIQRYGELVDELKRLQPDAVIYLQAIMKVTTERSEQGDYITNEGIGARNAEIAELADDQKIFFLDVNPLICDETGGMVSSYTYDGVHLKAQYIPIWLDFLKEHAVE